MENRWNQVGAGVVGRLSQPVTEEEFLNILKQTFGTPCIKHSALLHRPIKKVALCGGSGADFISDAKRSRADIYVTADVTYHRFAEANNELVIADIGHFESEQHTKEIIKEQYRYWVDLLHPDKNINKSDATIKKAEEKLKEINKIYKKLIELYQKE